MKRKDFIRKSASGLALAAVAQFPLLSSGKRQFDVQTYRKVLSRPDEGRRLVLSAFINTPINKEASPYVNLYLDLLGERLEHPVDENGESLYPGEELVYLDSPVLARNAIEYRITDYGTFESDNSEMIHTMRLKLEEYGADHRNAKDNTYEILPLEGELEFFRNTTLSCMVLMEEVMQLTLEDSQVGVALPYSHTDSGCFLTTACTRAMGLPDNCRELMILRNYRDNWMVKTEEGARLVKEYYREAPGMVRLLERQPNAGEIHAYLYETLVRPSVSYIERGKYRSAMVYYRDYVSALQNRLYGN